MSLTRSAPVTPGTVRTPAAIAIETVRSEYQAALERRGALCHARGRLADSLHALALDISGYDDGLPPAERVWLREAVRGPVSQAVQTALETLTRELARSLDRAPEQVRPAIIVTGQVSRIDFE